MTKYKKAQTQNYDQLKESTNKIKKNKTQKITKLEENKQYALSFQYQHAHIYSL